MPAYPFPEELPIEQIRQAKAAILGKGGKIYNPAWVVAGYGLSYVEPNDAFPSPSYGAAPGDAPDLTDEELAEHLDQLEAQADGRNVAGPISGTVIRAIAKRLLKIVIEAL